MRNLLISLTLVLSLTVGAGTELLGACGPFARRLGSRVLPVRVGDPLPRDHDRDERRRPTIRRATCRGSRWRPLLSRTVDSVLRRGSRRAALGPVLVAALGRTRFRRRRWEFRISHGSRPATGRTSGSPVWASTMRCRESAPAMGGCSKSGRECLRPTASFRRWVAFS